MSRALKVRFLIESAFLVAVAAVAGANHLRPLWIVIVMAVAYLLVVVIEVVSGVRVRRAAPVREEAPEEAVEPEVAREERPAPERHVRVLVPEPAPPASLIVEVEPEPEAAPEPVVLLAPPPPVPPPEPVMEPVRAAPEPEPVIALSLRDSRPRQWNLWELERLSRDRGGRDASRDAERAALLMELRQFAAADGNLPVDFDALVRETFGELIASAERT
jgi:Na+-transporting methylmalonyl-CoA/oxaloacetate decarboxylase gamma subunit